MAPVPCLHVIQRAGAARNDVSPDRAEWRSEAPLAMNREAISRQSRCQASVLSAAMLPNFAELSDQA
jgi:hypothetical protein